MPRRLKVVQKQIQNLQKNHIRHTVTVKEKFHKGPAVNFSDNVLELGDDTDEKWQADEESMATQTETVLQNACQVG
jgi:hypothetical protein